MVLVQSCSSVCCKFDVTCVKVEPFLIFLFMGAFSYAFCFSNREEEIPNNRVINVKSVFDKEDMKTLKRLKKNHKETTWNIGELLRKLEDVKNRECLLPPIDNII